MAAMVSSDSTATSAYVVRQPRFWPTAVPSGTPTTLATVTPVATQGHRLTLLPGSGELAGHQNTRAEVGAVGQGADHLRVDEHPEGGRQDAEQVVQGEEHHQPDQHLATRVAVGGRGQHRRTDHHPEGVGGDQPSGAMTTEISKR